MTVQLNPNDPNVAMLQVVARRLGADLCDSVVFVGGAVAGLLISDPALPAIRPTEDVDLVVEVMSLVQFQRVEAELRRLGFRQDVRRDAPICRWQVDGVTVDVMPSEPDILGFANRWYPQAVATATTGALPDGASIRLIAAPLFVATKLEAFHGRGGGDFLFSHDMGDLIGVIDGRDTLLDECESMDAELRGYLGAQFSALMQQRRFRDALPGHLPGDAIGQSRLSDLEARLEALALLR